MCIRVPGVIFIYNKNNYERERTICCWVVVTSSSPTRMSTAANYHRSARRKRFAAYFWIFLVSWADYIVMRMVFFCYWFCRLKIYPIHINICYADIRYKYAWNDNIHVFYVQFRFAGNGAVPSAVWLNQHCSIGRRRERKSCVCYAHFRIPWKLFRWLALAVILQW